MKFFIILLGIFSYSTALSQALSEKDKAFFLKESGGEYSQQIAKVKTNKDLQATKGVEPNNVLYASLKINKNTKDAIRQFSQYFNLDEQLAQVAAQELITAYKIAENCNQKRKRDNCPPTEFNPENIKLLNDSHTADDILFEIASTINYRDEISQFIEIVKNNEALLFKLFDYTEDVKYLAPLAKESNTPNAVLIKAALKPRGDETHPIDQIALDDFILKKNANKEFEGKQQIQNNLITQLFQNDLNTHAVELINQITQNSIDVYSKSKNTIFNCEKCADLSNDLIAYQLSNGNIAEASRLASLFPQKTLKIAADSEIRQFLLNLISPTIDRKTLYSWVLYGNSTGKQIAKPDEAYGHIGWLSSLDDAAPVVRKVAYQYFNKMDYPEFARYMKDHEHYRGARKEFALAKGLGKDYQDMVHRYEAQVKAGKSVWVNESMGSSENETYKMLVKVTEKDVPPKYQNKHPVKPNLSLLPTPLPMPAESIIRTEKVDDEWCVIYLSSALDPTGEVPAPGYWFIKTARHGIIWGKPAYMGIQMYFPYEIIPNAAMPMMSSTGIDLQANIKELDTGSITFPPVGLFFKRQKTNIVIHIELDDLLRDTDQDGLTDILEAKIGSNPKDPDTDKDGFADGTDTLPLTPFNKESVVYNQLGLLLLKKVVGIDEQAITVGVAKSSEDMLTATGLNNNLNARTLIDSQKTLFLTGNKDLFTGLDIPFRLVFVDEKLPVNTGYSLPTDIGWVFPNADHTEYYVIWSAHWAGGTFIIHSKNGKFTVEEISSWIT